MVVNGLQHVLKENDYVGKIALTCQMVVNKIKSSTL